MSDDELKRIMDFIIERQEYSASQIARLTESQAEHDERIARFERSYVVISQLLEKHDDQLVALTTGLNNMTDEIAKLAAQVNRYIAARGNGDNGSA